VETQHGDDGAQLKAGTIVSGRYEVRTLLGVGGFARVYSAFDKVIERDVALKVLDLAALGASEDQVKTLMTRFEREAKLAARIDHPCVVQIHDIGRLTDDKQSPFIVMEMLSGMDLEAYLRDHGTLEPAKLWELFADALEALGEAHRAGIIHRDLKPSNLFLHMPGTRRERLRIVDFGIAAIKIKDGVSSTEEMERLTRTGQLFGTIQYMAPEYIGRQLVSPALDVYQMALILVELISGERVVLAETPMDCLRLHTFRQMTLPEYLLKSPLRALLKQALDPDPAYRFADAHVFAEAMHKIDPATIPARRSGRRLQFLDDQDLTMEEPSEPDADGFEDTAVASNSDLSAAYTMEHGSSPNLSPGLAHDSEVDGFDDTMIASRPSPRTGPYAGPTTGAGLELDADRTFEERDADQTFEEREGDEDAFADTMIAAKPLNLLSPNPALGSPGGRIAPLPKLGGRTPLLRPGQRSIPSLDDLDGASPALGGAAADSDRPLDGITLPREVNQKLRPLVNPAAKIASPGVTPQFDPDAGALDDGPTVREMTFPITEAPQQPSDASSSPSIRALRGPIVETVRQHEPRPERSSHVSAPLTHATPTPDAPQTGPNTPTTGPITAPQTGPNAAAGRGGIPTALVVVGVIVIALLVAGLAFLAGQRSREADPAPTPPAERADTPAPEPKPEATPEPAEPAAKPAVVRRAKLDTIPQGAEIVLNGRPIGKTPLDYVFKDGQPTVVKVQVHKAGYVTEEVALDASHTATRLLSLTPIP
jgi:serine/threonine protein kinase